MVLIRGPSSLAMCHLRSTTVPALRQAQGRERSLTAPALVPLAGKNCERGREFC